MHVLDDPDSSIPTTKLPATTSTLQDEVMSMNPRQGQEIAWMVPPSRGFTNNKSIWVEIRAVPRKPVLKRPYRDRLICDNVYGRKHLSLDYTMPMGVM